MGLKKLLLALLLVALPALGQTTKFSLFDKANARGGATDAPNYSLLAVSTSATITYIAPGTSGYVLKAAGTGAPAAFSNALDGALITSGTVAAARLGLMTGDAGSGGTSGAVPAPGVGDATKFFNGAGGYSAPSGTVTVATKGDIQTYSSAPANLAVGADGKILTASSAASTGLAYAGGWVQIATVTTSGSQASVDFTSIPATFKDLVVIYQCRSNLSGYWEQGYTKFNNDGTSGNYSATEWVQGSSTTASSGTCAATASGLCSLAVTGANSTANVPSAGQLFIQNYLGTTFFKTIVLNWSYLNNTTMITGQDYGWWKSTAAITRVTITTPTSFLNGSVFTLYGVGTP